MYYKRIELIEGEPVLFVGCHALRFPYDYAEPTVAFVEDDGVVDDLLEACKLLLDGLDEHWMTLDEGKFALQQAQIAIAKAEGTESVEGER